MKLKGFMFAVISALFFGSAGIFVKGGYTKEFSPVDLLMLQYILATFILLFMCFIKYRSKLKLSKDMFIKLLIQGAVGNTLMTVFFYLSFKYLDVAVVTMILFTSPAMVALASFIIFKEKISRTKIITILGTFAGCLLVLDVFSKSVNISYLGVLFAILSAIFYSFMNLYAENIVTDVPGVVITFYTTVFSLVVLFVFNPGFVNRLYLISSASVINAGILAFFCEIIPLSLLYEAIKYIGPISTSIISSLEIPASAIIAFIFLRESLTLMQISGILLVIICIMKLKSENNTEAD